LQKEKALSDNQSVIFRSEFKVNHEEWINATKPEFGPGIKERIYEALAANYDDLDLCNAIREELKSALGSLLGVSNISFWHYLNHYLSHAG
jgi:amidase